MAIRPCNHDFMDIETRELTINQEPVRVHAISTGMVSVKTGFRQSSWRGIPAQLASFLDQKFTEWMPIWTWVIQHPEGIFLIDTGENCRVSEKHYFKSSGPFANWLNSTQFRFQVSRDEEIDRQLERVGLQATQISKVILTHLHLDHIDGIGHFPDTEILVNRTEWEHPFGDLPKLYPTWFRPIPVDLKDDFDVFGQSSFLTKSKDLVLVPTPGHTHGHCSVILKTDQGQLFFAGDVVYYEQQLYNNQFAAANVSHKKSVATYEKIKAYGKANKLIFLPSHDAQSADRLRELKPLY
jgi:N-acyl homoserine lactone hydrolase